MTTEAKEPRDKNVDMEAKKPNDENGTIHLHYVANSNLKKILFFLCIGF
jgi:hypothetical protein